MNQMVYVSAHQNGCNFSCNIGELGGVFEWLTKIGELGRVIQWPTQMGQIFGAILVNQVGCLSWPLKWVTFRCNIGELGRVIMWPTQFWV